MSPTEANATSSRSHAVLQINVAQKDRNADINEPHTMATFSIIDLAGSERASATKNRGERLIEGANINRSLLALGSCINALCDPRKGNHIPYRNSKLTRLLKFSLGGNCKTVMIVCVSPSSAHFDETQNTLRYANRAKNIQTKVTRNVFNVNRHVKDYVKKIDEQMALINELKQQHKELESVAMTKFRRQASKREAIAREGIERLRNAYEHSVTERQDRMNTLRKLRQIERRLAIIRAWSSAFDSVCEKHDEEEPQAALVALQKDVTGTLAELEESRQHCHRRLVKNNWQRAVESALQMGLKQLQDADDTPNSAEASSLAREAELLKSEFEKEAQTAVAQDEVQGEAAVVQSQIQQLLETVVTLTQLASMDEGEVLQAAKRILPGLIANCIAVTANAVRQDGSLASAEAFPPTKSGTPRRRTRISLLGPSPAPSRVSLLPPTSIPSSSSPMKQSSPMIRRIKVAGVKSKLGSPRKRSPKKRHVGWADHTEDGQLAEFSQTPQKFDSSIELGVGDHLEVPSITEELADSDDLSSPIPAPPQTSFDMSSSADRFQAGFLSRKLDSPPPPTLSHMTSSPEPSPLQEMAGNLAAGRRSTSNPQPHLSTLVEDEVSQDRISDSESNWVVDKEEAKEISTARKRLSVSRPSSIRDSMAKPLAHRRRSPPLVGASVFSPRPGSVVKTGANGASRRMTSGEVAGVAPQRPGNRVASGGRLSVLPPVGKGVTGSGGKVSWKVV